MYRLKEAIKVAGKLSVEAERLKPPAVSNWARNKVISPLKEYKILPDSGARIGLYPDRLPIEIAITAELKKEYRLERIKEAREIIIPLFEKHEDFRKTLEEIRERKQELENGLSQQLAEKNFIIEDHDKESIFKKIDRYKLAFEYAYFFNMYQQDLKGGDE